MTAPLAIALSFAPTPAEVAGAIWTCCGVELPMSGIDQQLVAYAGWVAAKWPGERCPKCGALMAMATRPRDKQTVLAMPQEPTRHLTKAEQKERYVMGKRAAELLNSTPGDEPEHTLEEAKRRLLPWGDPEHVGKPLSELPRWVLERARSWASAKKRADRFASLVRDIDLVLNAPGDMEEFPSALIEDDEEEFVA